MDRPTECRWCGAKCGTGLWGCAIDFTCGSIFWIDDCIWTCDDDCADGTRSRIQRAIDTLKKAKRYTVTPVSRNALTWDTDPDGYVTDSKAVDEALAILEGERDGETWHAYTEPPSDTRSVMLRFDPQGNHDCQGFYSHDFGSYARNETNARRLKFVHPTHWRELTEEER